MGIIAFIIVGFLAGLIARALMPGDQPMSLGATLLLGIIGSFLGGFIMAAIHGEPVLALHRGGLISSIIGAFVVLFIWGAVQKRRHVHT